MQNSDSSSLAVERVDVEAAGSPWYEEHLSRYLFASAYTKDKKVLDIACGTGFGSEYLLAAGAQEIVAADISEEAIQAARKRLSRFGVRAQAEAQDGTALSFENESFDVVVSIETIEHIENHDAFLKELARVLKSNGTLLISTPNALVTEPIDGKPQNPYHVKEFTPQEFKALLNNYFTVELAVGQHSADGYGVAPFLPSFDRDNLTFKSRVNFLYWRLLLRFPPGARDHIHRLLFGFDFYPRVEDYTFSPKHLLQAHVQYYVCRKGKDL